MDGMPAWGDSGAVLGEVFGVDVSFTAVLRGYDRAQVDAAIQALTDRLDVERERAAAAEARLARAEARGEGGDEGTVGIHAQREKQTRREAASRTNGDAQADADDLRRRRGQRDPVVPDGERMSADALAEAKRTSAMMIEAAERDARMIRARAQDHADQLRGQGEHAAHQLVEQARAEVAQLVGIRKGVRAELERLSRTLGGIREALTYELQSMPDDPGRKAAADTPDIPASGSRGRVAERFRPSGLNRPGPGWVPVPMPRSDAEPSTTGSADTESDPAR